MYGFSWRIFAFLFFVPDIFMCGYFINKKIGAITYNLSHNYVLPLILISVALYLTLNDFLMVGIIWVAHIGFDRMLGFGLKYPTGFRDTHLQRL
jgi:hypothetical protein